MKRQGRRPREGDRVRFKAGERKGEIGVLMRLADKKAPGAPFNAAVLIDGKYRQARIEDLEVVGEHSDSE